MKENIEEIRTVCYENQDIKYLLIRKQVKNINLRIKPDQSVVVSANNKVSANAIDTFVVSKGGIIVKALERYEELQKYAPKSKQFISGESFKIIGRDLRLKVIQSDNESVTSDGVYLFLYVKDTENFIRKENLIGSWIKIQCEEVFNEICIEVYEKFRKYGVTYPQIKIREMTSRWGSCQPKRGIITFNKKLIEAPMGCIEYVVLHEFCHFIHPNHSKQFYGFVQMLMPDWKERKKLLESREYFYLADK